MDQPKLYTYEEYQKNDIYHFKGRINLYYQNFIKQFDEERRNGYDDYSSNHC